MSKIKLDDLKAFCKAALIKEGMSEKNAAIVADVLSETDAMGIYSHGTKNLHGYIKKMRAGGSTIKAEPEIIKDAPAFAVMDAHTCLGMIPSVAAMELACEKASKTGIAIVTVKNSTHFGAAGYYSNIAAKRGMIGIAMSNSDPIMAVPGGKSKIIGSNPFSFAAPSVSLPSVFLDMALSSVASLKVVQAQKDGKQLPPGFLVDRDGLPTTDPSGYPEESTLVPAAAHKGYGLAIMVELLAAVLSGSDTSLDGTIPSWCWDLETPNNVSHAFIVINPDLFVDGGIADKTEDMAQKLRKSPKAKGSDHIYTPGEIEWDKYKTAISEGFSLPSDVTDSLRALSEDVGIPIEGVL